MLIIVGGPMFSGKTTWLIKYLQQLPPASFVLAKPTTDKRFSDEECVTHDGQRFAAINLDPLRPRFPRLSKSITTLLIDELNFFKPEALLLEIKRQQKLGRTVIGAGLFYDFRRQPFGATLALTKFANQTVNLTARCDHCGQAATNSYRKTRSSQQILLGAKESYGACCDNCWNHFNHE